MNTLIQFVEANKTVIILGAAYLFVGLANSLPDPDDPRPVGKKIYATVYLLAHLLANKAVEKRPGLAMPATVTQTVAKETPTGSTSVSVTQSIPSTPPNA